MTQSLTHSDIIQLLTNPVQPTKKNKKPAKPRKRRPLVRYSALINGVPFKVRGVECVASTPYGLLWRIRRQLSCHLTYPPAIDAVKCINGMVTSGDIVVFKTVRYLATENKSSVHINGAALSDNVPAAINRNASQLLSEEYQAEYIVSHEPVHQSKIERL